MGRRHRTKNHSGRWKSRQQLPRRKLLFEKNGPLFEIALVFLTLGVIAWVITWALSDTPWL